MRQLEYPGGPAFVSDTVNPVSRGVVMLADAMSWVLLDIWKDVSAMANLDRSVLPAVVKALVDAKAEEAFHSAQSSTLYERTMCSGVRRTVGINLGRNRFYWTISELTCFLHIRGRHNGGWRNRGSRNCG